MQGGEVIRDGDEKERGGGGKEEKSGRSGEEEWSECRYHPGQSWKTRAGA